MMNHQNLSGLSLRDLEYVQTVAELKSFGQAAIVCGISQPAISQQIRKLETRLGFQIFERQGRGFFVTPEGDMILNRIATILNEARSLLEASANLQDPMERNLSLGIIPTLGPYLMPFILRDIRMRYPNLKLNLIEEPTTTLEEMLQAHKADFAILATPPSTPHLAECHLFDEPYMYTCPEEFGLKNQSTVSWKQVDQDLLLFPSSEHCMRDQTLEFCNLNGQAKKRVGTSLEMLRQMVASGEGTTLLPKLSVSGADRTGGLVTVHPISDRVLQRTIRLVWRRSDIREARYREFAKFVSKLMLTDRSADQ